MPSQQGMVSASSARVEALKAKHKLLSRKIELEQSRPFISEYQLSELKREKLKVKEEIEGIKKAS
ncbi:MAG TPA: YdcH family protein [Alphaproteobacteria bacterium]|nr:YdcH family protein [Alphaproteobacteria bacterium]